VNNRLKWKENIRKRGKPIRSQAPKKTRTKKDAAKPVCSSPGCPFSSVHSDVQTNHYYTLNDNINSLPPLFAKTSSLSFCRIKVLIGYASSKFEGSSQNGADRTNGSATTSATETEQLEKMNHQTPSSLCCLLEPNFELKRLPLRRPAISRKTISPT